MPKTDAHVLEVILRKCRDVTSFRSLIGLLICEIDTKLSEQLTAVLEHPNFMALEGSWRGVQTTVLAGEESRELKFKIFDMSWDEVSNDLNSATDDQNSVLYRNIGLKELETSGGEPFGIVMIDHGLSMDVDGLYDECFTAQLICGLAESCSCPFIMGVGKDFFGEKDAAWMTDHRRIKSILSSGDYEGWQRLRNLSNARFLGLVWPQVLVRGRYQDVDAGFPFYQWPSDSSGLWANGGYAFLQTVVAEFNRIAWFGFLKLISDQSGVGAVVEPLTSLRPNGTNNRFCGLTRATLETGQFLSEAGFIPMCESTKSGACYFIGNRSVGDCKFNPTQEIVMQIQSVLIACRLVHYLKVQLRGLIGQIKTPSECELILQTWLKKYCSNVGQASAEVMASYPLEDAQVRVSEAPGGSARFTCEILVKPQYQIDHSITEINLSTSLGTG